MDNLDVAILREIGIEPFLGPERRRDPWNPRRLAQRLRVAARLVKDRVARLEREGIIEGYEAFPNLGALGLRYRSHAFRIGRRFRYSAALPDLRRVPGYLGSIGFVSDWVNVAVAAPNPGEASSRLATVSRILGADGPETAFDPPPLEIPQGLSRLDWRVLAALRQGAKRPLHQLARDVGVTPKSVQRSLAKLSRQHAFDVYARLGDVAFDSILFCNLEVRVAPGREREAVAQLHERTLRSDWSHCSSPLLANGRHFDLVASARTPRGLRTLIEAVEAIPGVEGVEGHLATGMDHAHPWLDAAVEAQTEGMKAPNAVS